MALGVGEGEADVATCSITPCLRAGLGAEQDSDVGADAAEALLLVVIEPDSEADEEMTEVMPQTMPNMVRKLRSLVSRSAAIVCLKISKRHSKVVADGNPLWLIRERQGRGSLEI